ncbi:MAG: sugar phosphate nucleotidyltransferase [Candidatus Andersenbacteria bacterium]
MIICGGIGARMGELTSSKPKSLLNFEGQPILSHILDRISIAFGGSGEVILTTGFGGDQIKNAYGTSYKGLTLRYAHDERQLGTRNRLLLAKDMISGPFLFLAGDIICEPRLLCELMEAHQQQPGTIATVGLAVDHTPAPGHGVATVDHDKHANFTFIEKRRIDSVVQDPETQEIRMFGR